MGPVETELVHRVAHAALRGGYLLGRDRRTRLHPPPPRYPRPGRRPAPRSGRRPPCTNCSPAAGSPEATPSRVTCDGRLAHRHHHHRPAPPPAPGVAALAAPASGPAELATHDTGHRPWRPAGERPGSPTCSATRSPRQRRRRARPDSNDVDLMHIIAGNAVRCGYLLVGTSERVYTRIDRPQPGSPGAPLRGRRRAPTAAPPLAHPRLPAPDQLRRRVAARHRRARPQGHPRADHPLERLQQPPSWPTPTHRTAAPRRPAAAGERGSSTSTNTGQRRRP